MTSSELERYLARASRGLGPRERARVREELRGNIVQLSRELQLGGLGEEAALARALSEFGPPARVNAGMLHVHAVPALLKSGVAALLVASAGLTAFSRTAAQVVASAKFPSPACSTARQAYETDARVQTREAFLAACGNGMTLTLNGTTRYDHLSVRSLAEVLRAAGARVNIQETDLLFPVTIDFPGNRRLVTLTPQFAENGDAFVHAHVLLQMLAFNSTLPVSVTGWVNPTVRVGDTQFTLGTPDTPVRLNAMFSLMVFHRLQPLLQEAGYTQQRFFLDSSGPDAPRPRTLRVSAPNGTVMTALFLSRGANAESRGVLRVSSGEVQNGEVRLGIPQDATFTRDVKQIVTNGDSPVVALLHIHAKGKLPTRDLTYQVITPAN